MSKKGFSSLDGCCGQPVTFGTGNFIIGTVFAFHNDLIAFTFCYVGLVTYK
jgi:hypothetical protein